VAKKGKLKQVVFDKNNRTKMQLAIAASFSCDMCMVLFALHPLHVTGSGPPIGKLPDSMRFLAVFNIKCHVHRDNCINGIIL
jgi:hypothetical protein